VAQVNHRRTELTPTQEVAQQGAPHQGSRPGMLSAAHVAAMSTSPAVDQCAQGLLDALDSGLLAEGTQGCYYLDASFIGFVHARLSELVRERRHAAALVVEVVDDTPFVPMANGVWATDGNGRYRSASDEEKVRAALAASALEEIPLRPPTGAPFVPMADGVWATDGNGRYRIPGTVARTE
jgi:hypothetical protein